MQSVKVYWSLHANFFEKDEIGEMQIDKSSNHIKRVCKNSKCNQNIKMMSNEDSFSCKINNRAITIDLKIGFLKFLSSIK